MHEIKKVGVWTLARLEMILFAIFGLIVGIITLLIGAPATPETQSVAFAAGFGVGAIIVLPILYGVMGLISGAVGAWLYNLVAGWVGGIKVELDEK